MLEKYLKDHKTEHGVKLGGNVEIFDGMIGWKFGETYAYEKLDPELWKIIKDILEK